MKNTKANSSTVLRVPSYRAEIPRLISKFVLAIMAVISICTFNIFSVSAAQLEVQIPSTIGVSDSFILPVMLDSQGENINAIEGNLQFPSNLILKEIREGSSVITFWVDTPKVEGNVIHFSGVTPGGFNGKGEVFTLVFTANNSSGGSFTLSGARALLSDGQGTETKLTLGSSVLNILPTGTGAIVASAISQDNTPPDTFDPIVGSDPNLFDGKLFVVFATQDKGSGIDHYEVAEKKGLEARNYDSLIWNTAVSPHQLIDQSRESYIYVKAIDRAGRERVSVVSPEHTALAYNPLVWTGILVSLMLAGLLAFNYVHSRKKFV